MPKYTETELLHLIENGDAQVNESGSITWSINNTYDNKPGTFLKRPPGAAPLITEKTAANLVAKKWEPYENMEAFERWRFRRKFLPDGWEKKKLGYIYFVQAIGEPFYIKIGQAKDPLQRTADLQVGSPVILELLAAVRVEQMNQFEKLFHEYFASKRKHGEWFDIRPMDVYELLNKFWKQTEGLDYE